MKVEWFSLALRDRDLAFDYIVDFNPKAAVAMDLRISEAAERLIDFPFSGRPGRLEGTRELVVTGTPYIAVYIISGNSVQILRVLHGAQMWPDKTDN